MLILSTANYRLVSSHTFSSVSVSVSVTLTCPLMLQKWRRKWRRKCQSCESAERFECNLLWPQSSCLLQSMGSARGRRGAIIVNIPTGGEHGLLDAGEAKPWSPTER